MNDLFEVYYDGDCPLCRREIEFLRRRDRAGRIRFTNIAAPDFSPAAVGVSYERLMEQIHGRLPDGSLISGVEVFRRLYAAIGVRWLVAISRWPGIRQILDVGYDWFARRRLWLTGRCNAGCGVRPAP